MYKFFKSICDWFIGLFISPFVLFLTLFVAIAIKAEDGGPVFYNGERIGKDGKTFKMCKFRSMKVNAPDIRLADGSTFNGEDDPRVTKIGKFLRKTSLDEFPQFFNLLFGQMSLIGPRPDPVDWLDKYTEEEKVFLTVKPGITGYNQAYFRNSADGENKIKNDVYYAENLSLKLDVKIFFKTIQVVVKGDNVYVDADREGDDDTAVIGDAPKSADNCDALSNADALSDTDADGDKE